MDLRETILNTEVPDGRTAMFYVGQVGFIFKSCGKYLLMDGYLTGPVIGPGMRFGRNYAAPITPEELDFIDIVLCSHDHMDHTDPKTLAPLAAVNDKALFIVPAAYKNNVVSYGVPEDRILPAHDGVPFSFGDLTITPIPSAHEELHQDENGDYFEMGYIFDFNGLRVYHSGDCCIYDGLKEKVGNVDVALLPINGRSYYRLKADIIGNMNLEEAIKFSKDANATLFIPLHFDLFPFHAVPPEFIPPSVEMYAPDLNYRILKPGESVIC